jgi:hypothetical protein
MQKTERIAGGERTRLLGVDNVIRNGRHAGGVARTGPKCLEGTDDRHFLTPNGYPNSGRRINRPILGREESTTAVAEET